MNDSRAVAALLDPERLAVAGALVGAWRTVDELAAVTQRSRRAVLEAVAELRHAGIATAEGDRFTIDPDVVRRLGREAHRSVAPMDPSIGWGMTDEEREVLARFFVGDRLVELPAARGKRMVVLERLSLEFEAGRHFSEREVGEILGRFHPDTASLRRFLVDEGFLDRSRGEYWRSGGRVDTS